jgi:hypothetical protein
VTETHQPRRDGRAHPARAGDTDFHACLPFAETQVDMGDSGSSNSLNGDEVKK